MSETLISVIIPVYNAAPYLERCLASICAQSFECLEIICVNDGSIDDSAQILECLAAKDARIRIISQANAGQSVARNAGLNAACGKYVGFVDADDWLDRDFYQKLYQAAVDSSAEIVQCGFKAVSADKSKRREFVPGKYEGFVSCIRALGGGFVWNKLYKRDFLSACGLSFAEGLIFEDVLFAVEAIYRAGRIIIIGGSGYNYFSNPESTVNNGALAVRRQTDSLKVVRRLLDFAARESLSAEEELALKDFICAQMVQPENLSSKPEYETYLRLLGPLPLLKRKYRRAFRRKIFNFFTTFGRKNGCLCF